MSNNEESESEENDIEESNKGKNMDNKSISFKKTNTSIPIAIIMGGTYNKKIIYLDKFVDNNTNLVVDNIYHHVSEKDIRKYKKYLKKSDLNKIKKAFETGEIDLDIEELYDDLKDEIKESYKKHIHIDDGIIQILPLIMVKDQTDRIMISGASGSGKSTFIRLYADQYHKLFPNNKVLLFSRLSEDKALDSANYIKRIKVDENFLKLQYEPKDFKDSLNIFDDIDTFDNKYVCEAVKKLRDDLLETGRHNNAYVIGVSHQLLNYKSTKILLNESNKVVFFPASGGLYQVIRMMKNYFGLMPDQINMIKKINSHWICLSRMHPTLVIGERDIYIL